MRVLWQVRPPPKVEQAGLLLQHWYATGVAGCTCALSLSLPPPPTPPLRSGPSQHPQHKSHPTSRALIHFANKEEASRAVRTLQNASWGQRRVQLKLLE